MKTITRASTFIVSNIRVNQNDKNVITKMSNLALFLIGCIVIIINAILHHRY